VTSPTDTSQTEAAAVEAARAKTGARDRAAGFYRTRYSTIAKVVFIVILLVWPLAYKNLYYMSIMTTAGLFAMLRPVSYRSGTPPSTDSGRTPPLSCR
jgi:hypothetical protein